MPQPDSPEVEELERTAAWRSRRPDPVSAGAAVLLEHLAGDLRGNDYAELWTELGSLTNWLAESDGISDYAALAAAYRARIGDTEHPADGAAYLIALLAIARGVV